LQFGRSAESAHAELVEARTDCGACLDKLGMSGSIYRQSGLAYTLRAFEA